MRAFSVWSVSRLAYTELSGGRCVHPGVVSGHLTGVVDGARWAQLIVGRSLRVSGGVSTSSMTMCAMAFVEGLYIWMLDSVMHQTRVLDLETVIWCLLLMSMLLKDGFGHNEFTLLLLQLLNGLKLADICKLNCCLSTILCSHCSHQVGVEAATLLCWLAARLGREILSALHLWL